MAGATLLMREDAARRHLEAAEAALALAKNALKPIPQAGPALAIARAMLRDLRLRDESFPAGLFGDYRWQALLTLYVARSEGREVRLLDLLTELGAPFTTGRRIVDEFEELGLFEIRSGNYATTRKLVSLTPAGLGQIEACFARRAGEG